MSRLHVRVLIVAGLLLAAGFSAAAPSFKDELAALESQLSTLSADPKLGMLAPGAVDLARASLEQARESPRSEREHWLAVVARRIEIARAEAEFAALRRIRDGLQRENDQLQLQIARRDAAAARAELERQRLQAQIQAEESERLRAAAEVARSEGEQALSAARAEVEQAKRMAAAQARAAALARKEAELAAAVQKGSEESEAQSPLALPAAMFATESAGFAPGASEQIGKAVAYVGGAAGTKVRIEVAAASGSLAQKRADALRQALVAAGIDAGRIHAAGREAKTARVEIRLVSGGS